MCWHPLILSGTASTSAPHPDPAALTNPATEPHRELPRLPVCAQGTQGLTAAAKAQPKATSLFSSIFVPSFSCRALGHLSPFFPHCFQRGNFSPVSKEPAARQPEAPQLWMRRAGHTVHKHWQQRCTKARAARNISIEPFFNQGNEFSSTTRTGKVFWTLPQVGFPGSLCACTLQPCLVVLGTTPCSCRSQKLPLRLKLF